MILGIVAKWHFKMENLRTATELVCPGYFMSNIDLKDAYFLVPVHKNSRKYLRFEFLGKLYQFTCLPNGLSTCPYLFTKILKPVINYLRSRGFMSVIYLDDILCIGNSPESCKKNVNATIELLTCLGFLINTQKSCLIPSTRCKYLGFIIDSNHYTLELTQEKKKKLKELVNRFLHVKSCSVKEFAQLIGSLVSACPAVEYGFVYTKMLEKQKLKALKFNKYNYISNMIVPANVIDDLKWWKSQLE